MTGKLIVPESEIERARRGEVSFEELSEVWGVTTKAIYHRVINPRRDKQLRRWCAVFLVRLGFTPAEVADMLGYRSASAIWMILAAEKRRPVMREGNMTGLGKR